MKKSSDEVLTANILFLSVLVFILSLQLLIIIVFIYQFIPLKMDPITQGVPSSLLQFFKPNRNHLFYHDFIAAALCGEAVVLYLFRKLLTSAELISQWQDFLMCETIWVAWQLFAVFKILQYDNPLWARGLLYAGFAAAVLAKIFWPELNIMLINIRRALSRMEVLPAQWRYLPDVLIVVFLFLAIFPCGMQKILIRIALFDNNNHFDQWLMLPLWAFHKGLIPAIHLSNPLNWGLIFWLNGLVQWAGGFNYEHLLQLMVILGIIYYLGFYVLLRCWLGILPAIFGVLLAVKLQMFHLGVTPISWAYPSEGILREFLDVAVFFNLWLYAKYEQEKFLWLAALLVGFSMSMVFDTGVYVLAGFYGYLVILLFDRGTRLKLIPALRQWRRILGMVFVPWMVFSCCLYAYFGPIAWSQEFLKNNLQQISLWLKGIDYVSFYSCLRDRNFYAFFASFVPPVLYAMGSVLAIGLVFCGRFSREKLLIVPLGVYGLGVYAHFLWHGTINGYYMAPLPLVASLCFWFSEISGALSVFKRRLWGLILIAFTWVGLMTNFLFTYYPNIFNMAGVNWENEKATYLTNDSFDGDANLVQQFTDSNQAVALISNFSTQILIQADRKPFFYSGIPLLSIDDLQELLTELDARKPAAVFVDRSVIVNPQGPMNYLAQYLKTHYRYEGQQSPHLILLRLESHENR